MLKNKTVFEVKVEDRLYQFYCDPNSPAGEVFDVLSKMKAQVVEIIKQSEVNPEPQEKPEEVNNGDK